jgi:hypothetical protein
VPASGIGRNSHFPFAHPVPLTLVVLVQNVAELLGTHTSELPVSICSANAWAGVPTLTFAKYRPWLGAFVRSTLTVSAVALLSSASDRD